MAGAPANSPFLGVQVLRFVAAALVVWSHAWLMVVERIGVTDFQVWPTGGVGVHIFFVISGFVMVVSSRGLESRGDGWKTFLSRRLIRIAPLYWLATTLKLVVVAAVPVYALHSSLEPLHVATSYLFLPDRNETGEIKPLLAVGWTLAYEMFFYALFAAALFLRRSPVLPVSVLLAVLMAAGLFVDPAHAPAAAVVYTDLRLSEFVLGMLIGTAVLRQVRVGPWAGLVLLALGIAGCVLQSAWNLDAGWPANLAIYGAPALVVAGTIYIEPWLRRVPRLLLLLGDSSYSLYLFHSFMVPALGVALYKLGVRTPWPAMAAGVLLPVAACVGVYLVLEKPLTEYLKRRQQRGAAAPAAGALRAASGK